MSISLKIKNYMKIIKSPKWRNKRSSKDLIEEILKRYDPVADYLGRNCYLDGIYFSVINQSEFANSISGKLAYKDNVGQDH